MTRPRLLDLFCCEGGAAVGYHRAGFDVTGVDIVARFARRYPFEFVCADALEYVAEHGHEYDVVHASPPCQAYSVTRHSHGRMHPELVGPTRDALVATGRPWVIENVVGAPLRHPLMLCGSMFDLTATASDGLPLRLERHRLFESSHVLFAPGLCVHDRTVRVAGVYGGGSSDRTHAQYVRRGGYTPAKQVRAALLGVDWMTLHGQAQAIPPAYTEWVGRQLLAVIGAEEGVA